MHIANTADRRISRHHSLSLECKISQSLSLTHCGNMLKYSIISPRSQLFNVSNNIFSFIIEHINIDQTIKGRYYMTELAGMLHPDAFF